jgi:5-formyltetrahydrofolate cyclo-ligase
VDEAVLNGADWTDVNTWRKEQRARIRAERLALAPAERRERGARILGHAEAGFPELAGAVVGFYWPFRGEVDVLPLLKRHGAGGGRAVLPVVVQRNAPVEWWQWTPDTKMAPGIWNIPVPAERRPLEPVALLVPLLGFDAAGYRLGNGGGYYDRTLATLQPRPLTLGIGYELGRLETIHPQSHDIPLDAVVTETGVHWPPATREGVELSSPVCYADEAASSLPEYFGYLSRAETLAVLDALLDEAACAWRRALGIADEVQRALPESVALLRELARGLATLRHLLAHVGGAAHAAAQVPAQAVTEPAAALKPMLQRTTQRLQEALPRIRDEALHAGLQDLLVLHERAGAHCDALLARLG